MKSRKYFIIMSFLLSFLPACYSNNYDLSKDQINQIVSIISYDANLPKELIEEVIQLESKYKINATSSVKAKGLMQLLSSNFDWFKWKFPFNEKYNYLFQLYDIQNDPNDIYNPIYNIWYGVHYLKWIMNTYSNSYWIALIIYNSGQRWYVNNEYPCDSSVAYANEIMEKYYNRIKIKRRYADVRTY